jgi:hypothetical protein
MYFEDWVGDFVVFFYTSIFCYGFLYIGSFLSYLPGYLASGRNYLDSLRGSGNSVLIIRFLLLIFFLRKPKALSGDDVFLRWAGDEGFEGPVLPTFFASFYLTSSLVGFSSITASSFLIYFYNATLLLSLRTFYFFLCVGEMFILLWGDPFTAAWLYFFVTGLLNRSSYFEELNRSFFFGLGPFVWLVGL